jgi:hypothetical protein
MELNVSEINPNPNSNTTSRVPIPRITTMAHKNRGSLVNVNPTPQKKVTYDDILSSLNMKVVDGKLQIVRNQAAENMRANNFDYVENQHQKIDKIDNKRETMDKTNYLKKIPNFNQQQKPFQQSTSNFKYPSLKQQETETNNTYSPGAGAGAGPGAAFSLNKEQKEQYKRIVAMNYLKNMQEKQRIQSVKSTKLMFSNTNVNISPLMQSNNDMNRLFRFSRR